MRTYCKYKRWESKYSWKQNHVLLWRRMRTCMEKRESWVTDETISDWPEDRQVDGFLDNNIVIIITFSWAKLLFYSIPANFNLITALWTNIISILQREKVRFKAFNQPALLHIVSKGWSQRFTVRSVDTRLYTRNHYINHLSCIKFFDYVNWK